jgi:cation transport regulator
MPAHAGESGQEEAAHRIAWAAVKRSYVKAGENWVQRHPVISLRANP